MLLLHCDRLLPPARASVYYVTVAGLGGEPDYEQRFTAKAKDLDKLFKASGSGAHVYTLTGSQATRAQLTETLASVAHDAKPEDDFVLTLIGHGSFDGVEYKFNLVGPDITAAELAGAVRSIPAKRQLIVNTTSASGGSVAALEKPGRGVIAATKTRHGEERDGVCPLLGGGAAGPDGGYGQERLDQRDGGVRICATARRRRSTNRRSGWRRSTRCLRTRARAKPVREPLEEREGMLLSSFTVLRIGAAQKAANDPAKQRCWRRRRIWNRRSTR